MIRMWYHPLRNLITPHGDRKPCNVARELTVIASFSLPLMGIENTRRRCGRSPEQTGSLPLMGIENTVKAGRRRDAGGDSLPLMGIENQCPVVSGTIAANGSLPLMGIENVPAGLLSTAIKGTSLPLMGIENFAEAGGSNNLDLDNSLPLMGIENLRRRPVADTGWSDLITPHGDRKPAPATAAAQQPTKAHYPSWGSKTPDPSRSPKGRHQTHYPSWGSKTSAMIRSPPRHNTTHYPSWGSKTFLLAAYPASVAHSLPLMGIENSRK